MYYFEDFSVNQRILFGHYTVTQTEIMEFAERFDPQVFHIDEGHPLTAELGGIMASGWHSTAIFMRLAVDAYLGRTAVLTSPGVDRLQWLAPVRSGDVISGEAIVEHARLSASKPDRGILTTGVRLWNQQAVDVLQMTTHAFVRVRQYDD
jgi:acyl dehydratase